MPIAVVAIGAAALGTAIGGVIGGALVNLAVGLAISSVASLFAEKPKHSGASIDSGLNVTNVDPDAPFPFVFGRSSLAGVRRFHELTNSNRWLHFINVYAAHEVEGNEVIRIDGEVVEFDNDGWATGKYADKLRVKFYTGAPDQTADPHLVANCPSWTSDHRLRGIAYAAVSARWDSDLFAQEPNVEIEFDGAKVYDPRDNSQDLSDPSTWKFSDNAILCAAHYLRGMPKIDGNGNLRRLFGMNSRDARIDWSEIASEANICDEAVNLAEGGTQKRYTANGVIFADTEPEEGIRSLLTACAGTRTDMGGKLSLRAGAARTPVMSLDVGDLIGPIRVNTKRPMRELFNAVKGQYRGPASNFEPDDPPTYRDAALIALDGGREQWLDVTLPFTDNAAAAQRIQRLALAENRRQISAVFPFHLKAMRLAPGDWFTFTSLARGWEEKTFRVKRWRFMVVGGEDEAPYYGIEIEAEEIDDEVYAWSSGDQVIVVPPPALQLPNPLVVDAPTLNEPEIVEWRDRALVRLSATPADSGPPVKYRFSYRLKGATEWTVLADRDEPEVEIHLDVGLYQFRVSSVAQPYGGRSPEAPSSAGYEWAVGAPPSTPRVTGLELVGGGQNNTFTGRDAIFQWRQGRPGAIGLDNPLGADVDQQDPYFAGYRVEIRTEAKPGYPNGLLLRAVTLVDTRFEYTFEMNYRDCRLLGLKSAQRKFSVTVMQISRYGTAEEFSLPMTLMVENPAPAVPVDLNIRTLVKELRVSFTAPTDPDFEGTIVWASTTPAFNPADVTPLFVGRGNFITRELEADTTYYVRVACYDAFIGEYDPTDVPLLNLSAETPVTTSSYLEAVDAPHFSFLGLDIRPNATGDGVEWDAGTAIVKTSAGSSQYAIASGSAAWTSGEVYVWYVNGDGTLSSGTDIDDFAGVDRASLAVYRGGTDIVRGDGGPLFDGNRIVTGSLLAGALRADTAYIQYSAQIGSLVVEDANIGNVGADKFKANTAIINKIFVGEDELIELDGSSGSQRILIYEDD